jgi:hypothetical protein
MPLPFNTTPDLPRNAVVSFATDEEVAKRIEELVAETGLTKSELVHRAVRAALFGEQPVAAVPAHG